jgi:HK97 family phage portal protein
MKSLMDFIPGGRLHSQKRKDRVLAYYADGSVAAMADADGNPIEVQKSLSNPTPEEEAIFTGNPVGSHAVSLATALTVPAVQSAVLLISCSIAALDIKVEKKVGDDWQEDKEHAVAQLLEDQPNDWTSTFELIRDVISTALTHDKGGLAWSNRVGGEVREIVRYDPAYYTIDYSTDGRNEPSYRINNRPEDITNVIHLRYAFSKCPLSLACEAIGVAKNMETHAGNLFKNAARPGGVLETPKPLGDAGVKKMIDGWRSAHEGPDAAGRTAVLYDGTTYNQVALSSVDAQFLETWKFVILEIARAFRVPPQLLYDFDRATWSNAWQASKEWLTGLEFWMMPLEAALRRALFTPEERRTYRIRFERDDYSDVDLTARATAVASLISSRAINPNEARTVFLDLPPYDGGSEYANPNTGSNQPGVGQNPNDKSSTNDVSAENQADPKEPA